MALAGTRWFVVASPTGSTEGEFFADAGTADQTQSGSRYINLNAISGGLPILDWGTAGSFPTYSAYSPGIYIRDYINSPYTSSIYTYIDSDDVTLVTSIQQDLQKIFFPGIVTGSSAYGFGGKLQFTGSSVDATTYNQTGSIQFIGAFPSPTASPFGLVTSMSIAPNSFNRVNFSTFLRNLSPNTSGSDYQFIYRELESPFGVCVFDVLSFNAVASSGGAPPIFNVARVTSSVSNATFNISSSITFINTVENQQTFYIVGVANPTTGLPFAGQSTVGTVGAPDGDLRSGIIKVYATESNNTADWTSLIRTVSGDAVSNYTNPLYVATNHNLMMFTASAGNAGTASWELLYTP